MTNPQQPEIRRSGRTSVTSDPAPEATDPKVTRKKGHPHGTQKGRAHGTDRGKKGGGKGGGTPPDQQSPYPS